MQRGLARLGLLAAVYIIVRGLDNVFVGLEEMKKRAAEAEEKQKRAREEAGPAATGARPTAPTDRGTTEG
jgi:hypothetical protein